METRIPVEFFTRHHAKFSELDPFGHMNNEHYLSYFMTHRMTGLRETMGYDLRALNQLSFYFVIRRLEIDFIAPLYGDDAFEIRSHIKEFRSRSATALCTMQKTNGELISQAVMEFVCIERKGGRAMEWPTDVVERFFREGPTASL